MLQSVAGVQFECAFDFYFCYHVSLMTRHKVRDESKFDVDVVAVGKICTEICLFVCFFVDENNPVSMKLLTSALARRQPSLLSVGMWIVSFVWFENVGLIRL